MRGLPRRSMLRLAAPIMIGADAALGAALRAGGATPRLLGGRERALADWRELRASRLA
jgi:hypothetical protein